MRPHWSGVALSQWCPRRATHWRPQVGVLRLPAGKTVGGRRELGRGLKNPPPEPGRACAPPTPQAQTSGLQSRREQRFVVSSHPVCSLSLQRPQKARAPGLWAVGAGARTGQHWGCVSGGPHPTPGSVPYPWHRLPVHRPVRLGSHMVRQERPNSLSLGSCAASGWGLGGRVMGEQLNLSR